MAIERTTGLKGAHGASRRAPLKKQHKQEEAGNICIHESVAVPWLYLPRHKVKQWAQLMAFWGSYCSRNVDWPGLSPTFWPQVPEGVLVVDLKGRAHMVRCLTPKKLPHKGQDKSGAVQDTKDAWPVYAAPTAVELIQLKCYTQHQFPTSIRIDQLCDLPAGQLDLGREQLGLKDKMDKQVLPKLDANRVAAAYHWIQRLDIALEYLKCVQELAQPYRIPGWHTTPLDQVNVACTEAAALILQAMKDPRTPQEAERMDAFTGNIKRATMEARWAAKRAAKMDTAERVADANEQGAGVPAAPAAPASLAAAAAGGLPPAVTQPGAAAVPAGQQNGMAPAAQQGGHQQPVAAQQPGGGAAVAAAQEDGEQQRVAGMQAGLAPAGAAGAAGQPAPVVTIKQSHSPAASQQRGGQPPLLGHLLARPIPAHRFPQVSGTQPNRPTAAEVQQPRRALPAVHLLGGQGQYGGDDEEDQEEEVGLEEGEGSVATRPPRVAPEFANRQLEEELAWWRQRGKRAKRQGKVPAKRQREQPAKRPREDGPAKGQREEQPAKKQREDGPAWREDHDVPTHLDS